MTDAKDSKTKEPRAKKEPAPRKERIAKPATKTSAKGKKTLAKINARALATKEWAEGITKLLDVAGAGKGTALERAMLAIGGALDTVRNQCGEISKASFELLEAGWNPPATNTYRVGELVTLRSGRGDRFTTDGAFTAEDIAELAVASVHGRLMKVKTGKNESLGLLPMTWFRRVEAKA